MPIAIVTGSGGLIGSESAQYFAHQGFDVIGLDNDMRAYFFGDSASTKPTTVRLAAELGSHFRALDVDIRDNDAVTLVFAQHGSGIELVVHCAAQPSHDWAAREPHTDFSVNAVGTLNLLQATRDHTRLRASSSPLRIRCTATVRMVSRWRNWPPAGSFPSTTSGTAGFRSA